MNISYSDQKINLLESYRAKAEKFWHTIISNHPNDSILDATNSLLILLIPITKGDARHALKLILSDNLDAELQSNGILPKQEEFQNPNPVPSNPEGLTENDSLSDPEPKLSPDSTA